MPSLRAALGMACITGLLSGCFASSSKRSSAADFSSETRDLERAHAPAFSHAPGQLPTSSLNPVSALPLIRKLLRPPDWATLRAAWGDYGDFYHFGLAGAAFDAGRSTLVTVNEGGQLRLWDVASRELRAVSDDCVARGGGSWPGRAQVLAVSSDELAAVGFEAGRLCIVDIRQHKKLNEFSAHSAKLVLARFVAGRLVTAAYQAGSGAVTQFGSAEPRHRGGEIRVWDPRTGAKLSEHVIGEMAAIAVAPDLSQFAARVDRLRAYAADGRVLWRTDDRPAVLEYASPDTLLIMDRGWIMAVSAHDAASRTTFAPESAPASAAEAHAESHALTVSQDGRLMVAKMGNRLATWNVESARCLSQTPLGLDVRGMALSPDGSSLTTWDFFRATLWSTVPLQTVSRTRTKPPNSLQLLGRDQDDQHVFFRSADDVMTVWAQDLRSGARTRERRLLESSETPIAADGKRWVTRAWNDSIRMRDAETGRLIWPVAQRGVGLLSSPDRSLFSFVALREPRTTDVVDASTGGVLWRQAGFHPLAFSPDSRTLYVLNEDRNVLELDARKGSVRRHLCRLSERASPFIPLSDGRHVLLGEGDRTSLLNLESGDRVWQRPHPESGDTSEMQVLPGGAAFLRQDGRRIHLQSIHDGVDLGPPLELSPMDESPASWLVSRDGTWLLVGTSNGGLMQFDLRVPPRVRSAREPSERPSPQGADP